MGALLRKRKRLTMSRTLLIGNLIGGVTRSALETLFAGHGAVRSARVVAPHQPVGFAGTGFVEMDSAEGARAAIAALNGTQHLGSTLIVSVAHSGDATDRSDD
jgi:RNA recognition motif-containing protein